MSMLINFFVSKLLSFEASMFPEEKKNVNMFTYKF